MKIVTVIIFILIFNKPGWIQKSAGQEITFIKVPELERILNKPDDKLYVLNFWASWCGPCVEELPYFEKIAGTVDTTKVEFLFISLDFPSQVENKLKPFLKKNNINIKVAVMMDLDYNTWVHKVDPDWQGNLPATLFFNNNRKIKVFRPESLEETQLKDLLVSLVYNL